MDDFDADEWEEGYRLTPLERWQESQELWPSIRPSEARLTPNPILRVLSALSRNRVRYLSMGGQACVFYGAAEFSRDTDILSLPDLVNAKKTQRDKDWPMLRRLIEADIVQHVLRHRRREAEQAGQHTADLPVVNCGPFFRSAYQDSPS